MSKQIFKFYNKLVGKLSIFNNFSYLKIFKIKIFTDY